MPKLKLAICWSASCGGCDVAILDTKERILQVADIADIVFWPIAPDFKRHHVEAMPDKDIDICLFMCMSIKKVAQALIQKGKEATEGILNMIEMAYRAYDPCIACATHSLPGQLPLEVVIYNAKGKEVKRLSQYLS